MESKQSKSRINRKEALVMSIINASVDSFAVAHPSLTAQLDCAEAAINQGADIIDIGGCSTRPGSMAVGEKEEWGRIEPFLREFKQRHANVLLSVDTFRAQIARQAVDNYGVDIINDVSGGNDEMYRVVANSGAAYVLTFAEKVENRDIVSVAIDWFEKKIAYLSKLGIDDIILDPGLGFNKSFEQNWLLLNYLTALKKFSFPVLVGLSRKSMIQKAIHVDVADSLIGTAAANLIALQNGADILRVHDVKAARDVIGVFKLTK